MKKKGNVKMSEKILKQNYKLLKLIAKDILVDD